MLERPSIQDAAILACLLNEYGLPIEKIEFLRLGADSNTAVFRATAGDGTPYFVKLRSGSFDEMTIRVPKLLNEQGMRSIIVPLATQSGDLWVDLGEFKLAVFPFVTGKDASEADLSDQHWRELGRALSALHTAQIPTEIASRIQQEAYSDRWRQQVKQFLAMPGPLVDDVAAELAAFLNEKNAQISQLVQRAEDLAKVLQMQDAPFVLCHADIHAWNTLIDADQSQEQKLYIVDWDTLILAPKERDLMFIGGGLFLNKRTPEEEERLFYEGYGQTGKAEINPVALAYYRYERIVQDIAAYGEQLLLTDEGGEDRANGLRQLMSQFGPNGVIEMAYRSEKLLPALQQRQ